MKDLKELPVMQKDWLFMDCHPARQVSMPGGYHAIPVEGSGRRGMGPQRVERLIAWRIHETLELILSLDHPTFLRACLPRYCLPASDPVPGPIQLLVHSVYCNNN